MGGNVVLVKDLMSINPIICCVEDNFRVVCDKLDAVGANCAIVVDGDSNVIGLFNAEILVKMTAAGISPNSEIGNRFKKTQVISCDLPVDKLSLGDNDVLPVVDKDRTHVGLLYKSDLLINTSSHRWEMLYISLNTVNNPALILNESGSITLMNKPMKNLLQQSMTKASGRDDSTAIFRDILAEVLGSGSAKVEDNFRIDFQTYTVYANPIIHRSDVAGVVIVLEENRSGHTTDMEDVRNYGDILKTVFDTAAEAIAVVDEEGYITMINQSYSDFLEMDADQILGKHVTKVIENTRLHIVLKTKQPELAQVQRIKGHDIVCNRIPIIRGNRLIGAVCQMLFRDVTDLKVVTDRIVRMKAELDYYKKQLIQHQSTKYTVEHIIGVSEKVVQLKELVLKVARTQSTVLIRGESGTGKELFAHAVHNASPRASNPFIKVNCAALPDNLLESELFGYREGAFTGAKKGGQTGKFELAHGGTIFLDEIGDMPISMQVKILRVLQEKEIQRLADSKAITIDVRVIAATNKNLETLISESKFREDLFYRLNVVNLDIPPIRERTEDMPVLVNHLLRKLASQLGCPVANVDRSALDILLKHPWPGNVRELENVLERALNILDGENIQVKHLPLYLSNQGVTEGNINGLTSLKSAVERTECEQITKALDRTDWDYLEAAKILGISKSTIYQKAAKYSIAITSVK